MRALGLCLLLLAACGGEASPPDAQGEGADCGGLLGLICSDGYYCDWPDDSCGALDMTGTCRARPTECAPADESVCGCDGERYDNACVAAQDGSDVSASRGC